ncbi:hypothetical protein ACO2Q0_14715 [Phenylobacterium sp. VNQ135]|uniref:hypothetical protein n=1 Tax=Phenylobacterium sp. VNQ135 TaxID=3400922 RepID=UPI003C08F2B2
MKTILKLAVIAAVFAPAAALAEARTSIVASDFGVFDDAKGTFTPTRTVSRAAKPEYGWMMLLDTPKTAVRYREELTGPAGGAPTIRERTVSPDEGVILNVWSAERDDPAGRYVVRVLVDEQVEKTFIFDVE